jgi:hypothetical protein
MNGPENAIIFPLVPFLHPFHYPSYCLWINTGFLFCRRFVYVCTCMHMQYLSHYY